MNDERFTNRRRMAWIAFLFMLLVGGGMLGYATYSPASAPAIEKLSFLIGTLFGMCTTVIVSYFTSSTVTQMNDVKYAPQTQGNAASGGNP